VVTSGSQDFEAVKNDGVVHCSVQNAAVSCVNQRERFTQYWASLSKGRRKTFGPFCEFLVWYLRNVFSHRCECCWSL